MNQAYEMQSSPVTASNFLAIDLAIHESLDLDSVIQKTSTYTDYRTKANRQALANTGSMSPEIQIALAADSFLLMDELYYLYNAALGTKRGDTTLLNGLEYYANYQRNVAVSDYLLTAQAIQLYNLGRVNQAFLLLNEGIAQSGRQAGLYSYIKAIWAYHQGALDLSFVLLGEAQSYNFDRQVIARTYSNFVLRTIDNPAQGLKSDLEIFNQEKADLSEKEKEVGLRTIALKNAFDEENTLLAISELKKLNAEPEVIYEILQQAVQVNQRSVPIYEAYVYQTAEVGLSFFGRSALETMKEFTSAEEIERIEAALEQKQQQRQREVLNIND